MLVISYDNMSKTVLVIDDNPSILKLMEKSFTMSNQHCTVCNDGRNAICLIDPYDLMHSTIETNYPFISDCNISALTHLYDGNANDKAVCEI